MAYNEKELEQMITVIKNLKKERNDTVNRSTESTASNNQNLNNNSIKDRSFYDRIFDKNKTAEIKKKDISDLNINSTVKDNVSCTKADIEAIVQKVIFEKVENQDFIKEICTIIIKEYSCTDLKQYILNEIRSQIEEDISKMIKEIMQRIGEALISA